jgi:hypothetical protein
MAENLLILGDFIAIASMVTWIIVVSYKYYKNKEENK